MILKTNATPVNTGLLISRAQMILDGATLHDGTITLELNKPDNIRTSLVNFTGGTLNGTTVGGVLPAYHVAVANLRAARQNRNLVEVQARKFCAEVVDMLKGVLGRVIGPKWVALGFTGNSLAIPADCLKLLGDIRSYFERTPTHEHAARHLTAAAATDWYSRLSAARGSAAQALSGAKIAAESRRTAESELRYRVSTVPGELKLKLGPEDLRWYDFGYRRPIDGRLPEPVEAVTLTTPHPGEVLVSWGASRRAKQYRVQVKPASEQEFAPAGVTAETSFLLKGYASGLRIEVMVTALNGAGETSVGAKGGITVG